MPESGVIKKEVVKVGSNLDLAESAARAFAKIVQESVSTRGVCYVALSGGSTPKLIYNKLVQPEYSTLPWGKIHFFVSDERCVELSSDESNYGNAERLLFSKVDVCAEFLHPPHGQESDPARAAAEYEQEVCRVVNQKNDDVPCFDLIFLGMGPDGHTASLFPGTAALEEQSRLVVENFVPKVNANRITFSFKLLDAARNVIFVVGGKDKAPVIKEIIGEGSTVYPSARVAPTSGNLVWMIDADAASLLNN